MTILSGFAEGPKSIILAADSGEQTHDPDTGAFFWDLADKFESVEYPQGPMAWGFAGSEVGSDIGPWLASHTFGRWEDFRYAAGEKIREINQPFSSDKNRSQRVISCLFAGTIDDHTRAIALDECGSERYLRRGAYFVGGGRVFSELGWEVAADLGHDPSSSTMRVVLQKAIDRLPALKGPINFWRITPDSFEKLTASEILSV